MTRDRQQNLHSALFIILEPTYTASAMLLLLFSLLSVFCVAIAELAREIPNPCSDSPTESARIVCEQLHKWDRDARAKLPVGSLIVLPTQVPETDRWFAYQLAPITSSPYQCMNLECLCSYLRGRAQAGGICYLPDGSRLTKAIRKEYRMLTDNERRRFHNAIIQLKRSGEYLKLALIHGRAADSGGAHSGPAFLPWHREFIKRFEIALRQIDPSVALAYWDSTLDNGLPNPQDSVMWTDELMGTTDKNGAVVGGDFAHFTTFQNHSHITRHVGKQGSPFKPSDLDWLLRQNRIENILAYTAPRQGCQYRANYNVLEYTHGNVHIFVGGDMFDPYTSGNDPSFYLHHSFVDYIWEMYRQQKQSRYQREIDYPPDNQACSSALHFGSALMRPFTPLRNIDGLSNKYTDNLYEFAPRPTCQRGPNCGSKYLFCDRSHGAPHCVSKVRIGGRCDGFINGEQVCYKGFCKNGRCFGNHEITVQSTTPATVMMESKIAPISDNCYNEHECCQTWAEHGECDRNRGYMHQWCKTACRVCKANFDPSIECSDHHDHCKGWARGNECSTNPLWMRENCRKSCNRCNKTRAQVCSSKSVISKPSSTTSMTTTRQPRPSEQIHHCNSPGCYNENVCCPLWGLQGQCSRNATWMACNCKVSCGLCIPDNYDYGTCSDYHRNCREWAMLGECNKNAWMLENCRRSCRSCMDQWQLRLRCRISTGPSFVGNPNLILNEPNDFYYDIL